MTDLVQRLRRYKLVSGYAWYCHRAADRIEALEHWSMKTLPFDYQRCKPDEPSDKCRECLRWVDLPGQVFGPRTAYVLVKAPGESGCHFVEKYDECK